MLPEQAWPALLGPYEERDECWAVREWLERRGYDVGQCSIIGIIQEQEYQYLEPGYLPK